VALTTKGQAAWEAIRTNGQSKVAYHLAGGIRLADGTTIHSHTVRSLEAAGLVKRVTYDHTTGETIDKVLGWHYVVLGVL
jgi:hypothetical protein